MFSGFTEKDLEGQNSSGDSDYCSKEDLNITKTSKKSKKYPKGNLVSKSLAKAKPDQKQTLVPSEARLAPQPTELQKDNKDNGVSENPDLIQNLHQEPSNDGKSSNDQVKDNPKPEQDLDTQVQCANEKSKTDILREQQQKMEEENKKRKQLLNQAIKDRQLQTSKEAEKLKHVKIELGKIDALISSDVSLLRDSIEKASINYSDAQNRYSAAEKEFVDAKISLHSATEHKELLTEHLCVIINQTEQRKAVKLNELMKELDIALDQ